MFYECLETLRKLQKCNAGIYLYLFVCLFACVFICLLVSNFEFFRISDFILSHFTFYINTKPYTFIVILISNVRLIVAKPFKKLWKLQQCHADLICVWLCLLACLVPWLYNSYFILFSISFHFTFYPQYIFFECWNQIQV